MCIRDRVQDVLRHITYQNDTPAGNATLRFSLSDSTNSSTADVTVTTDNIYITQVAADSSIDSNSPDSSTVNLNNGVAFNEAIAIANTQDGTQTLVPVSYTHLDVYKRQGWCRQRSRC